VAIADGNRAAVVAQACAPGMLRVDTPLGSHEPLYCTAVGKALLSDAEPIRVRTLIGSAPLTRYSPNTITNLEMLMTELHRTRDRGYAFDDEELHAGVRCIAAAVRDHSGTIVAAVRQTAVELSRELGLVESHDAEIAASS
jgi:IclR family acetate operon transcriptional repressor